MSAGSLRRRTLLLGLAGLPLLANTTAAAAAPPISPALAEALGAVGVVPGQILWSSPLTLIAPENAEDSTAVPVTLRLPEGNRPAVLHLFAPGNRKVWLASFTPQSNLIRPEWRLRIRVGKSQTLVAVARLSDGRVVGAAAEIQVTAGGGCRS